ncbi:hypothetical protein D918_06636 [Trichuris suis]|nr:hypothetical protein D918_06636 [Trichuris suis]
MDELDGGCALVPLVRRLFSPSMWSVYESMREGYPRTQNSVEACHRRWETVVGKAHMSVYRLVEEFRKEQQCVDTECERILRGELSASRMHSGLPTTKGARLARRYNFGDRGFPYPSDPKMVRTRGAKSEYSGSEPDEDAVLSGDVGDVAPRRTLREGETSGLAGRGGPWCQPPGTLSSGMDVDVWLGRLDDYLAVNAVPETRWLAIMKSLVDDKIYKNLRCLGPSCSFEQAKSYLLRRYGRGKPEFALRLQFSQRVQQPAESIEDFADELRRLGTEVGKHDADQKAQFIIGLQDANAQRYLLEKLRRSAANRQAVSCCANVRGGHAKDAAARSAGSLPEQLLYRGERPQRVGQGIHWRRCWNA